MNEEKKLGVKIYKWTKKKKKDEDGKVLNSNLWMKVEENKFEGKK